MKPKKQKMYKKPTNPNGYTNLKQALMALESRYEADIPRKSSKIAQTKKSSLKSNPRAIQEK